MSGDDYEELLLKTCKNSSRNRRHRFCTAVMVNMANSKEKSFNSTILNTLLDTINMHMALIDRDNSHDPQSCISLLNKTEESAGLIYEGGFIKKDEYNVPPKNH
jgi:hypothetical protein